jgi:pimeloyl-ACP methyl ester carboxylesterase
MRVPVAAVPAGATTAPLPTPGTAAYLGIDRVAFRHFGSGPDLLLITGEDTSMSSWPAPLLTALAQHYRVTIFDLPGTGYSGPLPPRLSLERWADDAAGLIHALHLTRPTVLGWGLGGEVALGLAERHPGSASSLVLVDTSAGGRDATPPSQADERVVTSPLVTATELARVFFSSHVAGAGAAWLQGLETAVPDDLTQPAVVAEARLQRALWSSDGLSAALGTIHLPVLVVSGSNDSLFPAPDGSLLAASIRGAKSIVFQGADYASIMEQTAKFVTSLEAFTG